MGTIIKSAAVVQDNSIKSSVMMAGAAAVECIRKAGLHPDEIDYVINIGVYRDSNMVEPAMAAMIQKEAGINLDYVKYPVERHCFAFDLINGPCGFLNAVYVAQGFLKAGKGVNALIVSSNAHPSNRDTGTFPFRNTGAAMILGYNDNESAGFLDYMYETSADGSAGLMSYVDLSSDTGNGRERLTVEQDESYIERLLDFSCGNVKKFIARNNISLSSAKLITSQISPDFSERICRETGFGDDAADNLYQKFGDTHTSSLMLGYCIAVENGSLENRDSILFVNSGSGLSMGCALYKI